MALVVDEDDQISEDLLKKNSLLVCKVQSLVMLVMEKLAVVMTAELSVVPRIVSLL